MSAKSLENLGFDTVWPSETRMMYPSRTKSHILGRTEARRNGMVPMAGQGRFGRAEENQPEISWNWASWLAAIQLTLWYAESLSDCGCEPGFADDMFEG